MIEAAGNGDAPKPTAFKSLQNLQIFS